MIKYKLISIRVENRGHTKSLVINNVTPINMIKAYWWTNPDCKLLICLLKVIVKKDKRANVHFRCIASNQNEETFWTTRNRNSVVEEGGGGINTYVAGTGKYEKMIGTKCPYGVQYHEDIVWYTHRCKLN